ncbi:hypothetical protein C1Y63_01180 [Corynebacterium sp. 13CS0277]|uniref:hypothetical protein n=1 Tax=Corynebacterium sp. 13CS0277 TaxID=2071994 RepID=UPI000D04006D|nr:hypothetical protein [Corynebacterium sp. 13CS0277]PRQ12433.1 hypothetical protein C1Y63_01180 [Corynebacterium sp. 13CS0277]
MCSSLAHPRRTVSPPVWGRGAAQAVTAGAAVWCVLWLLLGPLQWWGGVWMSDAPQVFFEQVVVVIRLSSADVLGLLAGAVVGARLSSRWRVGRATAVCGLAGGALVALAVCCALLCDVACAQVWAPRIAALGLVGAWSPLVARVGVFLRGRQQPGLWWIVAWAAALGLAPLAQTVAWIPLARVRGVSPVVFVQAPTVWAWTCGAVACGCWAVARMLRGARLRAARGQLPRPMDHAGSWVVAAAVALCAPYLGLGVLVSAGSVLLMVQGDDIQPAQHPQAPGSWAAGLQWLQLLATTAPVGALTGLALLGAVGVVPATMCWLTRRTARSPGALQPSWVRLVARGGFLGVPGLAWWWFTNTFLRTTPVSFGLPAFGNDAGLPLWSEDAALHAVTPPGSTVGATARPLPAGSLLLSMSAQQVTFVIGASLGVWMLLWVFFPPRCDGEVRRRDAIWAWCVFAVGAGATVWMVTHPQIISAVASSNNSSAFGVLVTTTQQWLAAFTLATVCFGFLLMSAWSTLSARWLAAALPDLQRTTAPRAVSGTSPWWPAAAPAERGAPGAPGAQPTGTTAVRPPLQPASIPATACETAAAATVPPTPHRMTPALLAAAWWPLAAGVAYTWQLGEGPSAVTAPPGPWGVVVLSGVLSLVVLLGHRRSPQLPA